MLFKSVEGSGEVSLDAPADLAVGFTFSPASISVGLGFGMVNHADHGNNVQGTVEAYPMHVLSFDFQSDVTTCGRHIRFFNVIDEYTRTALAIIPRRSFKATDVVAVLENIIAETGTSVPTDP